MSGLRDGLDDREEKLLRAARSTGESSAVNAALIEVLFEQHHTVARKLDRLLYAVIATLGMIAGDLIQSLV